MPALLDRRRVLAASAAGLASLAGCSVLADDEDESGPDPYPLGAVELHNRDEEDHEVELLVQRNGEPVHWETYELGARRAGGDDEFGGEVVPASAFDCTPGQYRLSVRLETGVFDSFEGSAEHEASRRSIRVERGGEGFTYLVDAGDSRDCPTSSPQSGEDDI